SKARIIHQIQLIRGITENSTKSPQRQNAMQNQEGRFQNFFALICKTE
ncbi:glutamate decarboxylase isozyme, partial [Shigella dysenteriae]